MQYRRMARNDRISLLREQRGRTFADAVQGLAGKPFAGLVQRRMTSTPWYFPVATIIGDLCVRRAHVV